MAIELKYSSFSFSPFNAFRILFFGFIFLSALIIIFSKDYIISFILSAIIIFIILSVYIATSYSEVKLIGKTFIFKDFGKTIRIDNVTKIKTWWAYDFGVSSVVIGEGATGTMRSNANKMNCYVKFESNNGDAYIYEQIYMGSKFPNNHLYNQNEPFDKTRLFKVWDIDNCIEKLKIEGSNLPSNK